jgi:hypothetical protein
MTTTPSWFNEQPLSNLIRRGTIVTLTHPEETKWEIGPVVNKRHNQLEKGEVEDDRPS